MTQPAYSVLLSALQQKAGFQALTHVVKANQLRITGRCHPDRWGFFLPVIYTLQRTAEKDGAWTCDISKQYFMHNGRIVYCWRLIFQSDGINEKFSYFANVVLGAPNPTRVEVDEVLLPGYKPGDVRGGVNAKGKGVASAGAVPMIISGRKG